MKEKSVFFKIVSEYALDDFFNTADEQMSRMASMMPGRESSFSESYSYYGERFVKLIEKIFFLDEIFEINILINLVQDIDQMPVNV
jgi:hypothetical protein